MLMKLHAFHLTYSLAEFTYSTGTHTWTSQLLLSFSQSFSSVYNWYQRYGWRNNVKLNSFRRGWCVCVLVLKFINSSKGTKTHIEIYFIFFFFHFLISFRCLCALESHINWIVICLLFWFVIQNTISLCLVDFFISI